MGATAPVVASGSTPLSGPVCGNPASHRAGLLTLERQGCIGIRAGMITYFRKAIAAKSPAILNEQNGLISSVVELCLWNARVYAISAAQALLRALPSLPMQPG